MAVVISDNRNINYNQRISTPNGFYKCESYNLNMSSSTPLSFVKPVNLPVVFEDSGNCMGIVLSLYQLTTSAQLYIRGVNVILQENVGGTWTDRTSKILQHIEIHPEGSDLGLAVANLITPFKFDTPYPVDTASNKWRFNISHDTSIPVNTINSYQLATSNTTLPSYVTWCDNIISVNNDDTIIAADKIIIDKTITLKGTTSPGEINLGVSSWICRSMDLSKTGISLLEWDSEPLDSYTLTLGGVIYTASFSSFRVGYDDKRIPLNYKAVITTKSDQDYGTIRPGFYYTLGQTTSRPRGKCALFMYGEKFTLPVATLSGDTLSTNIINLYENVENIWEIGDKIVVGKQDVIGQGQLLIQTITNIQENVITTDLSLNSIKRLDQAPVINISKYAIEINSFDSSTKVISWMFEHPIYLELSGCRFFAFDQLYSFTSSYYNHPPLLQNTDTYIIENNLFYTDSNSNYYGITRILNRNKGTIVRNNISYRTSIIYTVTGYNIESIKGYPFRYAELIYQNNLTQSFFSGALCSSSPNVYFTIIDNKWLNGYTSTGYVRGNGKSFRMQRNYFFGSANATLGTFTIENIIGGEISDNIYEKNNISLYIGQGVSLNTNLKNETFINNNNELSFNTFYFDILIDTPTIINNNNELNIDTNNVYNILNDGSNLSRLKIVNEDGNINKDRVITPIGIFRRCGENLEDTTVLGNNKYSLRFNPTSYPNIFSWKQTVPTGNIKNKNMVVLCKCKISTEDYYVNNDYILPTLKVTYDQYSYAYSQSLPNLNEQTLSVVFEPITEFGEIILEIYGTTTAIDSYFYVGDGQVLYPAGHQVITGNMGLWSNALPVIPWIATNLQPADVWSSPIRTLTAGTKDTEIDQINNKLTDIKYDTEIIPALLK